MEDIPKRLPDLNSDFLQLKTYDLSSSNLESLDESNVSSEGEYYDPIDIAVESLDEGHDIWTLKDVVGRLETRNSLTSWDTFLNPGSIEPRSAYLSDAGATGYDAALRILSDTGDQQEGGRLADPESFLLSLHALGLGRNSAFFYYDARTQSFTTRHGDTRLTGVSQTTTNHIINDFTRWGCAIRKARDFSSTMVLKSRSTSTLVALASATGIILSVIESSLELSRRDCITALQLHALFSNFGTLVEQINILVRSAESCSSNTSVLSILFEELERLSFGNEEYGALFYEIGKRIATPWILSVEYWVGLYRDSNFGLEDLSTYNKVSRDHADENYQGNTPFDDGTEEHGPDRVSNMLSPEALNLAVECGQSYRLLSEHRPEHPLCAPKSCPVSGEARLEWVISWKAIQELQTRASRYEGELRQAISQYNSGKRQPPPTESDSLPQQRAADPAMIGDAQCFELCDIDSRQMDGRGLGNQLPLHHDELFQLANVAHGSRTIGDHNARFAPDFGPPLSSTVDLSFTPMILAQSRLVGYSCLHMLFEDCRLISHLKLQRRYHLMGDGAFVSRLSQALFDPEQESGERKAGVVRSGFSTGLRLGSRENWPPASSELRLVLMGILSESYTTSESDLREPRTSKNELPGGLSFAIRDLPEEELEKCKDPDSIEALDFLRLQYKAPSVVEAILIPSSLHKYDRLFRYLLRLVRLQAVVRTLLRDITGRHAPARDRGFASHKFRVEAFHFITTLNDYSSTIGIGSPWAKLESLFARIERYLAHDDYDGVVTHAKSIHNLRDLHKNCLDQILHSLFLSKSHTQVMTLIEDVFGCILRFAVVVRNCTVGEDENVYNDTVSQLYQDLRRKVLLFVRFLQDMERAGPVQTAVSQEVFGTDSNLFGQLLLRLNMNQFY